MITCNELTYFFESYFSNFITSISCDEKLSAPALKDNASKDEWINRLLSCARTQQELCSENDASTLHLLSQLRASKDMLTSEHYDIALKYCRKLYYSQYNEPTVLLEIVTRLIPFYEKQNDIDSLIFLYSCGGYSAMQISRTGDLSSGKLSVFYYRKVISYQEDIENFALSLSRDYIFVAYDNLIRVEPHLHNLSIEDAYLLWQDLCTLRTREKFCQFDKSNPRIPKLCQRAIDGFITLDSIFALEGRDMPDYLHGIIKELTKQHFEDELAHSGSIYSILPSLVFSFFWEIASDGLVSWEDAWFVADDYYFKKTELLSKESANDNELDYLTFYVDLIIYLIEFLNRTNLSPLVKQEKYAFYRKVLVDFLTSHAQLKSFSLSVGLRHASCHTIILKTFDSAVDKINFIINLMVSSHLTTLTHSVMVSYLAESILKRILTFCPQLLLTPDSEYTVEDVLAHRHDITDYTVQAALLHDIGKNSIIPIINTQHRKLTDYEFSLIRLHPENGSGYLSTSSDFAIYHDIALGHHKSYDGAKGYPAAFDNVHSKYRAIIDLIHICDCLDAATDYLSRNYHKAKSFETVMQEFVTGKGTDYNPELVDLILEHADLYQELQSLAEKERENIYYDVYLTFVNRRR